MLSSILYVARLRRINNHDQIFSLSFFIKNHLEF